MRIAQVAPLHEAVPPRLYGGTERIVSFLTEGLVQRGHDVTLFASGDSETSAKLVAVRDVALRLDPNPIVSPQAAHLTMLHEVRKQADRFDVIHFHLSHFVHFPVFEGMEQKTVTTPHGRLDYSDLPAAYRRWPDFPMISISKRQRKPLAEANWVGNVYHGLPLELFPRLTGEPAEKPYLAFLGRMSRAKRPDRAIDIARRAGMTLKIAAKIEGDDEAYYREEIRPLIESGDIEFVGEVDEAGKVDFFAGAHALLFPIDWPEPFGLVVIEAMAFGVPVIAWPEGAMPEIVDDGVTGFIVDTVDEAAAAVRKVGALDRAHIRQVFERRFSARRMVSDYEAIYASLVSAERKPNRPGVSNPSLTPKNMRTVQDVRIS
ncbi:MAG TPA: glycosyltransferase family 4 protein [Rhizobiaceae bacterium]|nr:glycosyltransferase family 4 protein [Rhizobiaceae bacterium]